MDYEEIKKEWMEHKTAVFDLPVEIHDKVKEAIADFFINKMKQRDSESLEALIEGCGEKFYTLEYIGKENWQAHTYKYNEYYEGSTPKEAVKNLLNNLENKQE